MDPREQMDIACASLCRQNELYGVWARQHGLSYNLMMTLYALGRGPCTQKQIVEQWLLPKQSVNTVVKELERQGYIHFAPGRDQKEKLVCFTAQGRRYGEETLRPLYEMEDRVMARMGPDMCRQLVDSSLAFTQALAEEVRHG